MPRTGVKGSPNLRIDLIDPVTSYCSGDVINGYVISEKTDGLGKHSPYVRLSFFGRAKTKYIVKRQHGTTRERGRASFFDGRLTLENGPICKEGHHAWKFSLKVPDSTKPGILRRGDAFDPSPPFLATRDPQTKDEVDVTKHSLPPIMYHHDESYMSGKTVEVYIEYAIVAEMGDYRATVPIYLRKLSTPTPITEYKLGLKTTLHTTKTPRLLPENADKALTMGQKLKKSFTSSKKTPRYTFSVKVAHPTILQLEHPDPIPLKIFIFPNLDPEKTTICPDGNIDSLPPVKLTSMSLKLMANYSIRTKGTYFGDTISSTDDSFPVPFPPKGTEPLTIPVATSEPKRIRPTNLSQPQQHGPSPADLNPSLAHHVQRLALVYGYVEAVSMPSTLDLGAAFSIALGSSHWQNRSYPGVGSASWSLGGEICPSLNTYNICVTYYLKWTLKLACAGDTFEISGTGSVEILAPSEEQEKFKQRRVGTEGTRRDYDGWMEGAGQVLEIVGDVLQNVS